MLTVTDELYEAVIQHDHQFDGQCYIGIVSTGIVCFPSCRSRTPKRENIWVFATFEEARQAGFRACKRCQPDNPHHAPPDSAMVREVLEILGHRFQENLTLHSLADTLCVSPYHLQRTFKRVMGVSPAQQLRMVRIEAAQQLLRTTESPIGDIALDVGFRTLSHFSATFRRLSGISPQEYRHSTTRAHHREPDRV